MKTLVDLCAIVARRHDLVNDRYEVQLPKTLKEDLFDECCVGVNVSRAYELGHVECVEKGSRSVDAYKIALKCALYGNREMTLKTLHLFPEGARMLGNVGVMWPAFPKS